MTLYNAAQQYIIYLQALRLPKQIMAKYLRVLRHIMWFYGKSKPLSAFNEPTVLQYVKLYDPFDCTMPNQERGEIFCSFTHWLMVNQMIPAWSKEKGHMAEWVDFDEHQIPDDYYNLG